MIKIETERLLLYPLSDEEMQKAYSEMLQGCLDNPEDRVRAITEWEKVSNG